MNPRWVNRFWPAFVVGISVIGVAVVALYAPPVFHTVPVHHAEAAGNLAGKAPSLRGRVTLPAPWLGYITLAVASLGAVILVTAIIIALRSEIALRVPFLRSRRDVEIGGSDHADNTADVLVAIDAGISELADDDADPRAAVIGCWVRLERVASVAGVGLSPDETSSDLVARLLQRQRVSRDTLANLAELYRTARYSSQVIEAPMREAARDAFKALRREIVLSAETVRAVAGGRSGGAR